MNNKLIAYASDGMGYKYEKEVISIGVLIGNRFNHFVCDGSVLELIKDANNSGKMQIYICDNPNLDGKIDASPCTPLYTNGQISVDELVYNGIIVWSKADYYNLKKNANDFAESCSKQIRGYPFGHNDMVDAYIAGYNNMIEKQIKNQK